MSLLKKTARVKEEYAAKEKRLKEKQELLEAAKTELRNANTTLKLYEIENADKEYKRSLNIIDSGIIKQMEEDQGKSDKNKGLAEEARMQKLKKEFASKRSVSKRAMFERKRRKVSLPRKQIIKSGNKNGGEVLESALEMRNAGLEMQRKGDFDSAVKYYQQALIKNPKYATVHNDLGILYEQIGHEDKAKMEYLTALKIDPRYIKAHSNIALLYEKSGDYKKAYYHWKLRVNLGREKDPWTLKAKQRMRRLENRNRK